MRKAGLTLPLLFLLFSCAGTPPAGSSSLPEEDSPSSSETKVPVWEESYPEVEAEEYCLGTYGGYLLQLEMGYRMTAGDEYECSFEPDDGKVSSILVETSDPEGLEAIVDPAGDFTFLLKAKKAGNYLLTVYGDDGFTYYQKVVGVRKEIPLQEMDEYLFSVTQWNEPPGYPYGTYEMTFVDPEEKRGLLLMSDEMGAGQRYDFTYEYAYYESATKTHFYSISYEPSETARTTLSSFSISRSGDFINLWYAVGGEETILCFLLPSMD